ncbi:MAG: DUF3098 domain-containing protein [Bacteroidaceae bacterium]|nr:DUF3098 domain-containing protein [Bacteroidaceae bacterium]
MSTLNFAFGKKNYLLVAIGVILIVVGFLLMTGPGSTETTFEPDIFSVRRIKVAPVVCFVGFILMIYAVMTKPKNTSVNSPEKTEE